MTDKTPTDAQQYLNVASQCAATATSELAKNVLVDDGSGTLRELLNDAADAIRAGWGQQAPAQPAQPAQRFDAADMATAAAQGFRDGAAKEQQAEWQPIETAPKDGQAILVTDGMDCYCVEWDEEFDWWAVDDNKLGPFRLRGSAPTHWMKLPEAPGPADGERNE